MGTVNNSAQSIKDMNATFSTEYTSAFQSATSYTDSIVAEVKTNSPSYRQVWLTEFPGMRKALGERHIKNLQADAKTTSTYDSEVTVSIPRADVLSDQWGLYSENLKGMGVVAKRYVNSQVVDALANPDAAYDGVPFFSANHPAGDPALGLTQSNVFTNFPLNKANLQIALARMKTFKGRTGEVLDIDNFTIHVAPSNEYVARQLVEAALVPSIAGTASESNTMLGAAKVIVNPKLPDDGGWYLHGEMNGAKALYHVTFLAPELISKTSAQDSDMVFNTLSFVYGVDCNTSVNLGLYFLTCKCTA